MKERLMVWYSSSALRGFFIVFTSLEGLVGFILGLLLLRAVGVLP